ncbi:MAG: DUF5606 domain-containing protein [Odoribacter splanchnicus]
MLKEILSISGKPGLQN